MLYTSRRRVNLYWGMPDANFYVGCTFNLCYFERRKQNGTTLPVYCLESEVRFHFVMHNRDLGDVSNQRLVDSQASCFSPCACHADHVKFHF